MKNPTRPEVVLSRETVVNTSVYCIKVEQEVGYCEYVYAVSAIFLLPVSVYVLVGRLVSPALQSLAPFILRIATFTVLFDVKRRSTTLLPVLAKLEVT